MSKKFWIDFSGYLCVKAESDGDAEKKFWHWVHECIDFSYTDFSDDVWDIEGIEERVDDESDKPTSQDWEDFWREN